MSGRHVEVVALCVVVVTLPFYRFGWSFGGLTISPTEAAIWLTAALVGARRLVGAASRTITRAPSSLAPPDPDADAAASGGLPAPGRASEYSHDARPAWDAFDGPIMLFLVAALLSLLATEYLRLSLRELRTLVVEPILFWYLCRAILRSPADAAWPVSALVGVTTLVAVVGLAQLVFGGAVTDVQGVRRVLGTYTSPNHFALLLGRVLPFLVAFTWIVPRARLWAAAAALVCAGAQVATFSVGGWIGTWLGVLVVIGLAGGRRVLLGVLLAGLVAAVVFLVAAPAERLAGRLDPRQGTSLARVQLWQAAVELIRESPVLGIGLDNFLYRYPAVVAPEILFEPNLSHPHNLILQFWLQLGLPGLAALGWLIWRFLPLAWSSARDATGPPLRRALAIGALGSMTDFVAHGLVDNSYFLPDMAVIFWLTLAVGASVAILPVRGRA